MTDTTEHQKCPICGETMPEPRWYCLPRAMRIAEKGKPCGWSIEGHERLAKNLGLTGQKIAKAKAAS